MHQQKSEVFCMKRNLQFNLTICGLTISTSVLMIFRISHVEGAFGTFGRSGNINMATKITRGCARKKAKAQISNC